MSDYRLPLRVLCAVFLAVTPGLSFLSEPAATTAENLRNIEQQIHQEVNRVRATAHIPTLSWSEPLAAEARRHAKNLAGRRFFAHEDPARGDLASRLDKSGINWLRCAENLYEQGGSSNPAQGAVKAWLDSAGHRKNMMDSMFSDSGVGVALQRDGTLVVVQEYMWR
jgi:uncharacterized protein YkwD